MEILSYNIHFGKKLEKTIDWIKKLSPQPDIICLQEFPLEKLNIIKKSFYKFGFNFSPSMIKSKKIYGELTAHKKSLIRIMESLPVSLGMNRMERKICRLKGERSALVTKFMYKDQKITITNVQLTMLGLHHTRRKQIYRIIQNLPDKESSLIVGDYNYSNLTGNKSLKKFMKKNSFQLVGTHITTHHLFKIPQQLDYVFVKNCSVNSLRVEKIKFSDHLPIIFSLN